VCDLGYLREPFTKPDGSLGYRCAGEPVADYVRKGGAEADITGRKCLCNGLLATIGLGQRYATHAELPLITAGHDIAHLNRFFGKNGDAYNAADVIHSVLGRIPAEAA